MFGRADNTAFAGETLQGRASTADLEVQWFGLPGPRFNVDRNPRKPGPLAINGRLFVQGMGRVAAMDAYNGTILWTVEIPRLQRYNILRDTSNWCADADSVYLAYDQQCLVLDAKEGIRKSKTFDLREVLPPEHQGNNEWGYIARVGQQLFGSTVEKESAYKEFWGNKSWYDEKTGPNNRIVCSDRFFALDPKDGKVNWVYTGGAILQPTISIADGKAYFVESRNPALKKKSGRLDRDVFKDMRLVAIDLKTGAEEWSQAIHPLPGLAAFSMACSEGKIVLVSSESGKFGICSYDAKNGAPLWDKTLKWEADHHGKHLSRPAIVGDKLVVRPYVLKLSTGAITSQAFPKGHTCASYCATDRTLIFRAGEITMWNLDSKEDSRWPRLRSDCLLSTIAAQGMVLSPEGGGGCSCGIWLEISVGFLPISRK
jgi:outer membrane protein assembly factor BamB